MNSDSTLRAFMYWQPDPSLIHHLNRYRFSQHVCDIITCMCVFCMLLHWLCACAILRWNFTWRKQTCMSLMIMLKALWNGRSCSQPWPKQTYYVYLNQLPRGLKNQSCEGFHRVVNKTKTRIKHMPQKYVMGCADNWHLLLKTASDDLGMVPGGALHKNSCNSHI